MLVATVQNKSSKVAGIIPIRPINRATIAMATSQRMTMCPCFGGVEGAFIDRAEVADLFTDEV